MKVTFVLPGGARFPAGGTRMVFRYANTLVRRGTSVTIVMPSDLSPGSAWKRVLRRGRFWVWSVTQAYRPDQWFQLDSSVRLLWTPSLASGSAPAGDAVIATSVRTAEMVATWPSSAGSKYYFVQGYETWDFPKERVEGSWRLPLRKFAVSAWLCELITQAGSTADHLRNSVDLENFGLDQPVGSREGGEVLWPHHPVGQKGSGDVLAVLRLLNVGASQWACAAFSTTRMPSEWPTGVAYHENPTQKALRTLYNQASIMIAPSHSEGWGLPACEALLCGCGLVATDIGGHREFLRHEENALLYAPGDLEALRRSLVRLREDAPLRLRLAQQGYRDMQALTLEPMVTKLETLLRGGGSS